MFTQEKHEPGSHASACGGDCSHFCTVHRHAGMKDAISKVSCEMLKLESHGRWQTVNSQHMLRANVLELSDASSVPLVGSGGTGIY